jgi:uncharacterized membrane protein AbrB (regulator of aidB expression)
MSTKKIALAWLIGLALAGCATTMSDEDKANAARVRITNDREIARGCAFIGMASGASSDALQWKAAWLGGDVAVITMETQEAAYKTAEVFRCAGG